ncbi:MAG: cytochrome c [Xanthobacteraceae bacterium]|nr:cytochrome c [Xanthobacteraceae bacterium]
MMRFGVAAVAVVFSVHLAVAQDFAAQSQSLMKANNDAIGVLVAIAKGDKPYDQAAVDTALARLGDGAAKMPTLYPDSLKGATSDARYSPSAKVWDDRAGFAAQISSFGVAVTDAKSKTKDIETLKASVGAIGNRCGGCHETYRVRNG